MRKVSQVNIVKIEYFVLCLSLLFLIMCFGTTVSGESDRPCADDVEKFCKNAKAGEGRLIGCLQEHKDDLSATCGRKLDELKQRLKETQQACALDVEKVCKGVQPGAGRIVKCLRQHTSEISPNCKQKIQRAKEKMDEKKSSTQ